MKIIALSGLLAASAVTLAACGGATSSTAAGNNAPAGGAGLHAATTSLGKVLVDAQGRTVYLLTADSQNTSTCGGECLTDWPASTAGHAKLGVAVGSTKTPDGTTTATVAGQPVYTFSQDHAAGDVNGEGLQEFGGTWYAVSATGQAVTGAARSTDSSSSPSPSAHRYGY
jgi:predicted lipoprotein with Yx(FWY)xxD motif